MPVETAASTGVPAEKPKRGRRKKAEIEAEKAAESVEEVKAKPIAAVETTEAPAKKRRGRPRKVKPIEEQ